MSKISKAFENGKAFIPFLTCGDPDLETTAAAVRAAVAELDQLRIAGSVGVISCEPGTGAVDVDDLELGASPLETGVDLGAGA